ncbi:MAG TPA: DUF2007 domain-containing protein [Paludibaculum sp.]|jgi:hypothetical protein
MELVTVLETRDSFAVKLAKAALEDAGIECVIREERWDLQLPGIFGGSSIGETPLWKSFCQIQVAPEFEEESRALLENLQDPEPLADEGP